MKGSEALSVASSIATLTGVSFTWLAALGDFKNASAAEVFIKGVVAVVAGLFMIGVSYGVLHCFLAMRKSAKPEHHIYVWTFGLGFSVLAAAFLLGLIWGTAYFFWVIRY